MYIVDAKIEKRQICCFVRGKWRKLRGYNGGKPSSRIMNGIRRMIWINIGKEVPEEEITFNWV